jgi:hypothetical protein
LRGAQLCAGPRRIGNRRIGNRRIGNRRIGNRRIGNFDLERSSYTNRLAGTKAGTRGNNVEDFFVATVAFAVGI